MKKLLLLTTLAIFGNVQAQRSADESFNVSMTAGTHIGAELEYKGSIAYVRPSIQFGKKATDIYSAFGINFNNNQYTTVRYYVGGRIGITARVETNAMAGLESGIDVKLGQSLVIGLRAFSDYKSDYTFYEDGKKWNNGLLIKFGVDF